MDNAASPLVPLYTFHLGQVMRFPTSALPAMQYRQSRRSVAIESTLAGPFSEGQQWRRSSVEMAVASVGDAKQKQTDRIAAEPDRKEVDLQVDEAVSTLPPLSRWTKSPLPYLRSHPTPSPHAVAPRSLRRPPRPQVDDVASEQVDLQEDDVSELQLRHQVGQIAAESDGVEVDIQVDQVSSEQLVFQVNDVSELQHVLFHSSAQLCIQLAPPANLR